jgi:two-component system, OmpR family, KDP operon response regulator KdpE
MALETNGWTVLEAETLARAIGESKSNRFDMAIVDLGLPDGDGVEFVRSLRERSRVPIIVLSARAAEADKVRALDAGADDYVEKPFRVAEFLARVRAHARRQGESARGQDDTATTVIGDVEFDRSAHLVRKAGKDVRLTKTQYKLFDVLVTNAGRVMTHRQLLREVWGPGRADHTEYLRVFMASLRQKLEDDASQPKLIITETGIGYRLVTP